MNHPPDKKKQSEPSPSSPQQDAPRHIRQAQALIANHRAEEALAVCEQALAIQLDDADLLLTTATLLSVLGQFDKAIRRFTQLLERDEQSAEVLLRAVAYAHRGRASLESNRSGKAARALSDGEQAMGLFLRCLREEAHPAEFQDALLLAQQGRQEAQALLAQITRLVEANLGLIWPILTRYRHLWQGRPDEEEVFQEAALGL